MDSASLASVVLLQDVFGVGTTVRPRSYVDRLGLDERFQYLLRAQRHVSIHGDSKQGKSWLRRNSLPQDESIVVQCVVETSTESLFSAALGHLGVGLPQKSVATNEKAGSADLRSRGKVGLPILAQAEIEGALSGTLTRRTETEDEPVGMGLRDLSWVATTIKTSGKRLVIEDFHYVSEARRREIAFNLKALLDYEVFVIVVGVWPRDLDLLTYYDGDLDGRVEDVYLSWTGEELDLVLTRGFTALNCEASPELRAALIEDAFGNVGLLQRLAEQLCIVEGITRAAPSHRPVALSESMDEARSRVSASMSGRFGAFADNFVRGMKRLPAGLEVYRHLLHTFTAASDEELLNGIDSQTLLKRINEATERQVRQSDLTQALDRIDRLQAKIKVSPPVLTYSPTARRVFLGDRAFLFYRRYAHPSWPWDAEGSERDEPVPGQTMLDLDD
jgi:hypothetical protein